MGNWWISEFENYGHSVAFLKMKFNRKFLASVMRQTSFWENHFSYGEVIL